MEYLTQITTRLLDLPVIRQWPELKKIIIINARQPHFDWELPGYIARALGAGGENIVPGAAALACAQTSIILVDDLLDDDPKGVYRLVGTGPAANMALALQAAAFTLLAETQLAPPQQVAATSLLAQMSQETALGQQIDISTESLSEENYWALVRAKSVPFYKAAFELGGILAGAGDNERKILGELGSLLGEMVQIHDDMGDALAVPANPDWVQNRLNLLLLYATLVDYPQKQRFQQLRQHHAESAALAEAQSILIHSGAASFAVYHLAQRNALAQARIRSLADAAAAHGIQFDPSPLETIFDVHIEPVIALLKRHHIPLPDVLQSYADE